jgi:hypothetical protein
MVIDWEKLIADFKGKADASLEQSWGRRRAFLRQVGIDRHSWKTHRLRESDGLTEDAWWVAVRSAMQAKKNHGVKMLGKPIPKGGVNASSVRAGSE